MNDQPPDSADRSLALEIRGVSKRFGRFAALDDVSLLARDKEFLALLGPSGSGKTTLLRVLAGLETPDAGDVRFGGEDFLALPAQRRRVGMVFQHYALFRHMTVAQNIAFGLVVRPRAERPSQAAVAEKVRSLLALVQLEGLGRRYPAQLSGGQRQRVALARALAIEPRMLLLDEPFGALDAQVRRELRRWLREVHDRAGVTTVFVTHDQEEALDLADRVAILKEGALVQVGVPQEVYERPASAFVFDFLGAACRLPGEVRDGALHIDGWALPTPAGAPAHGPVEVYFRPHEACLAPADEPGIAANVRHAAKSGPVLRVECEALGRRVELQGWDPSLEGVSPGQAVKIRLSRPSVFPPESA